MIDGDRWISERLAFLREALNGDLSAEQRQAIDAEIAVLKSERGIHHAGPHLLRLPRRLTAWGRARTNRTPGDPSETQNIGAPEYPKDETRNS